MSEITLNIDVLCTLRTFHARFLSLESPIILQTQQILVLLLLVLHMQILKIMTLGGLVSMQYL